MKPIHHLVSLLFLLPPWSTIKNQAFCGSRLMRSLGPNKWWNRAQNRVFLEEMVIFQEIRSFSTIWKKMDENVVKKHKKEEKDVFSSLFPVFLVIFLFFLLFGRICRLFSSFGPLFVDDVGAQIRWKRKRGFHSFSWSTNGFSWKKRRSRNGKKKSWGGVIWSRGIDI